MSAGTLSAHHGDSENASQGGKDIEDQVPRLRRDPYIDSVIESVDIKMSGIEKQNHEEDDLESEFSISNRSLPSVYSKDHSRQQEQVSPRFSKHQADFQEEASTPPQAVLSKESKDQHP